MVERLQVPGHGGLVQREAGVLVQHAGFGGLRREGGVPREPEPLVLRFASLSDTLEVL